MDTINFSQFNTKFPLNTGDFLVGYDSTLLEEYKTNIINVVNQFSDYQFLSFNENSQILNIYKRNNVSLSSLNFPESKSAYSTVFANSAAWSDNYPIKIINESTYTLQLSDINYLLVFDTPNLAIIEIPNDSYINYLNI